jgi:hypothetical protein
MRKGKGKEMKILGIRSVGLQVSLLLSPAFVLFMFALGWFLVYDLSLSRTQADVVWDGNIETLLTKGVW